ncbi:D-sedoheptulose 7-phosphate isomerase [Desulfobaculum bizertense]|uniref:Phosphoheptose isomerase n=1 Tax=Desulfobaculum bizertense DSM 18034 TaxID=1121442 RepID=A0A1T4X286_9BACT|nr:D-sedoheptulose 7-phosphate isomerase [Desulfobaculum bizertense]UIJ37180.1 D-sedoheptulose 7-phosphate isomerase [Desulfobaculum bizertense]SKA83268.1 phosphoheptose isomerase [Desulfobaculum bizertense DSM 18034]
MPNSARNIVLEHATEGARLREEFFRDAADQIVEIARLMAVCLARGGKILLAGNGGSAADAQHLAAEFVNRFLMERPPLPAIALTTDSSILTAVGNDYGFDQVFEKQVLALGNPGDVFLAISTSGNSTNLVRALRAAQEKGLTSICLSGKTGGEMAPLCEHKILVPHEHTPLIQEIHIAAGHLLCQLVDYYLFEAVVELTPYLEED